MYIFFLTLSYCVLQYLHVQILPDLLFSHSYTFFNNILRFPHQFTRTMFTLPRSLTKYFTSFMIFFGSPLGFVLLFCSLLEWRSCRHSYYEKCVRYVYLIVLFLGIGKGFIVNSLRNKLNLIFTVSSSSSLFTEYTYQR